MARPRTPRDTKRKRGQRDRRPRVLIVCEGEKTEPYYFKDLAHHYRLSGVKVLGASGLDPKKLVEKAKVKRDERRAWARPSIKSIVSSTGIHMTSSTPPVTRRRATR